MSAPSLQRWPLRVLAITSEWPTAEHPGLVPFIVRQVQSLRNAGLTVDVFSFRGAKKPLNYLRAWVKLRRSRQFGEYDLIHAHFGQSGLLALPKEVPLVVTFWGSDVMGIAGANSRYHPVSRALQLISTLVAKLSDEAIVVSRKLTKRLPPRHYHVIPSGVDLQRFRPVSQVDARTHLGLPLDRRLVLFAGHPQNPVKRHSLAQSAICLLDRNLRAELIAAVGVQHADMPLYFNACDALLLTSLHEGSPSVVKEALACNTPIVAVDVGDVRERIGSVAGCVVCADDDPQTIARALADVLRRGQRIEGRAAVCDLDEPCVTERIIRVYQRALEHGQRAG